MTKDEKEKAEFERLEAEEALLNSKKEEFASKEELDSLKRSMNSGFEKMFELLKQKPEEKAKAAIEDKKIDEAGAEMAETNPRYDRKVREILGDRVQRTFVTYPKGGGTLFTIVLTKEASNSPKDYLERMGEDRRTVNIEREEFRGEDGVALWAKMVLQNLGRTLR